MKKTAIVTGAASGVGQATVLKFLRQGWRVACVARSIERLEETLQLAGTARDSVFPVACDIGDPEAVRGCGSRILSAFPDVEVLVNSAGTNVPKRSLEELSLQDYRTMIASNLDGAYYWTQVVLPSMRARKSGTIVNVVSDAGKLASPKAGPAYVMSKFGLAGLTQSINAEERGRGIRACAVFPGDISTPLLEKRPAPPDAASRERMLKAEDVADCVLFCINLPQHAIVEELMVRPR